MQSYNIDIHSYAVSTGQCEQVCFAGEHLTDPVKPQLKRSGATGQHYGQLGGRTWNCCTAKCTTSWTSSL